jgi:hypothetical protein
MALSSDDIKNIITGLEGLANLAISFIPGGAAIAPAIQVIEGVLPAVIEQEPNLLQSVQNLIAKFSGQATEAEQLAALNDLDAKVDAAWNAAKSAWLAAEAQEGGGA